MRKRIILYFLVSVFLLAGTVVSSAREHQAVPRLLFFYSQTCHACHKTKHEVMPAIEKEFQNRIIIEYLDIADISNYALLLSLEEKYAGNKSITVPAVFIGGKLLIAYNPIKDGLRNEILAALQKQQAEILEKLPGIDLAKRFLSFGAVAIVTAGLIDGINPCAFTVIVFFISFLAFQGYRKKELIAIGSSFICAVFLTYVLIGVGIFRFLYSINKFYFVTKTIYYLIAIFCFSLAVFALYDAWVFRKTQKTEGLKLQLPQAVKNKIHSIIGAYYRKPKDAAGRDTPGKHFIGLIGSAFVTGFMVSLLEAVCTGQLYLPTIAFVMKDASLRLRALGYLLLYNFMFIVPLFAVLLFALFGATSQNFSNFVKKHMLVVKLLTALVFSALGLVILLGA